MKPEHKALLTSLFEAAVGAADPDRIISEHIPERPKGRTVVIGAGKGAAQLARAFERKWDGPLEGAVVTRYGFGVVCERITVLEARHPVPDENGIVAAKHMLGLVSGLGPDDLVVALMCGGGSALLPSPPDGFLLKHEIELNQALLTSGAPISAMNVIRKHFSTIKGGRLAMAASPAKVISLIVSDVPGDDPAQVASGPTVADETTFQDAQKALKTYEIKLPSWAWDYFASGHVEAPRPGNCAFDGNEVKIVASAKLSLGAAVAEAQKKGFDSVILSDCVEGESRDVGTDQGAIVRNVCLHGHPYSKPTILLSGGETTVTFSNRSQLKGRGGPNTEFMLGLAISIDGLENVCALAADTDGIDGSEDNAGAFADGTTRMRLAKAGLNPQRLLQEHNAWEGFQRIGDLFVPGPTGTNVNDFRAILIA